LNSGIKVLIQRVEADKSTQLFVNYFDAQTVNVWFRFSCNSSMFFSARCRMARDDWRSRWQATSCTCSKQANKQGNSAQTHARGFDLDLAIIPQRLFVGQ